MKRVLLVDSRNYSELEASLDRSGFIIERASSGREALQKWAGFGPDAFVLTLARDQASMPSWVNELRSETPIPIILVTEQHFEAEEQVGVWSTNSNDPEAVVAMLRKALGS